MLILSLHLATFVLKEELFRQYSFTKHYVERSIIDETNQNNLTSILKDFLSWLPGTN